MEQSAYKDFLTSRGLNYHYYFHAHTESKPTLLLLHGFPSGSGDWHNQVSFFQGLGYGIIALDMLGYGGTAKPANVEDYRPSLITKDIMEILDAELQKQDRVIAIGHNWGSKIVGRLSNFYAYRFDAFAFLAVPYMVPMPQFDLAAWNIATKEQLGYENYGYWLFFSEEDAGKLVVDHWDSFYSILHTQHPSLWKTDLIPIGGLRARLEVHKVEPLASYITDQDKERHKSVLEDGFTAPRNWYKILTSGISADDDKLIAEEDYTILKPVFYGPAKHDYIAISERSQMFVKQYSKDPTIHEFDAGHWFILSHPNEVNQQLKAWIDGVEKQ